MVRGFGTSSVRGSGFRVRLLTESQVMKQIMFCSESSGIDFLFEVLHCDFLTIFTENQKKASVQK